MRVKFLLTGIGMTLLTSYFAVAGVLATMIASARGAPLSLPAVLVAALPGWLATFQVPLTLTGVSFTVPPLLPTILVMWLIASASLRVARRSRARRPKQALWVILAMGLSHAVCGSGIALLADGLHLPARAEPVEAFLWCGAVTVAAATAGLLGRCGLLYVVWERVGEQAWRDLRIGVLTTTAVLGVGALVLATAVCLSLPEILAVLMRIGSAGDAFGSTVLSVLYLPGAVLAGWSFSTGVGLSMGDLAFRPMGSSLGALPEVPLLAILPGQGPAPWWAAVLVLPAAVGGVVGWTCRHVHENPYRRMRTIALAALVATASMSAGAMVVGGRLGGGGVDPITLHPWMLAVATFCWIALPAAAIAWFAGPGWQAAAAEQAGGSAEHESVVGAEGTGDVGNGAEDESTGRGGGSTPGEDDIEDGESGEGETEGGSGGDAEVASVHENAPEDDDTAEDEDGGLVENPEGGDPSEDAEALLDRLDIELAGTDPVEFDDDIDHHG
ncbi:hypothetical protein DFQ14_1193 [Halopolyspora algeriensis]|uniref:Uncharacterized protein n=1 Tax=Halopolyspora algeriensis TaxID=1500506 RepID=A0A368VEV4_9ACTN|nr:hypothetical protein DFQ14_1193 [Halopolyspora algeriensis]TQM46687.1 hypothetical protein FHU43_3808 [Halopolyspora algeriensis]